jgi:hypothetical protein
MSKNTKIHLALVPVTSALALCSGVILETPGLAAIQDRQLKSNHPVLQTILKERPVSLEGMVFADGEYAKCHTKVEAPTPIGPVKFSKEGNCPAPKSSMGDGEKEKLVAFEAEQLVAKLLLT